MEIWSFPKVYNLGHPALESLLDGDIVVQEKVDGSQFSFGVLDSELRCRSKGAELYVDAPDKMFTLAVETAVEVNDKWGLLPGYVYRAEYLLKPKHNALAYERVPAQNVILYDIERAPNDFLAPEQVRAEAYRIGLETVPEFSVGKLEADEFAQLLDLQSCLGGPKIEGVVVKNYARFGRDGKVLMGKHVSESFKEVHRKEWKAGNPTSRDAVQNLVAELRSEGRWAKAVQHLREAGELENDPRDIGKLIKEIQRDVEDEERDYIKEKLFAHFISSIRRGAAAGVAEWYKQQLFQRQFDE